MKNTSWVDDAGKVRRLANRYPGYVIEERPLPWQLDGLQQTRSGYGARLTTSRVVRLPDGKVRRIYATQFSNNGTCWIVLDGVKYVVND